MGEGAEDAEGSTMRAIYHRTCKTCGDWITVSVTPPDRGGEVVALFDEEHVGHEVLDGERAKAEARKIRRRKAVRS